MTACASAGISARRVRRRSPGAPTWRWSRRMDGWPPSPASSTSRRRGERMDRIAPSGFLRRVLLADAICSGAMGLLLALLAGPLSRWFGLPGGMLQEVGIFLLVFAAFVAVLGLRHASPRLLFWLVI